MEIHLVSYYIGILIIFFTNLYIIFNNKDQTVINYSYLSIFGALLIAFYFMDKEHMWDYLKNSNKEEDC
jgi:lipid-A-disaccharide synthase-like uncharacterized protein